MTEQKQEIVLQENQIAEAIDSASSTSLVLDNAQFQRMVEFSKIMANGTVTIPKHLQGKESDCFAIVMQSVQWKMNPFAVAQKTHLVNGVLGYEAQLYNAVVCASGAIVGRFHYEFFGDWDKFRDSGYSKTGERGCGVSIGAVLRGHKDVTWIPQPIFMDNIAVCNSPLWKNKPQQQLCYVAVRDWARLYTPDVVLGVYTDDELVDAAITDDNAINPAPNGSRYKTPKMLEKHDVAPFIDLIQQKAIFADGRAKGLSDEEIKFIVFDVAGINETAKLTPEKHGAVMDAIKQAKPGKILAKDENLI